MVPTLLLPLWLLVPRPAGSLLAAIPEDAYVLVHCADVGALRERAERNDWYRLLGSKEGEPLLGGLLREVRTGTRSDTDGLLAIGRELQGEVVFFDTGTVAGFVAEPPGSRDVLAGLMRDWVPGGEGAVRRTLELPGGPVELVAWPDEIDGWSGRSGHFAAFVERPHALALYSGDDAAAVRAALTRGVEAFGGEGAPGDEGRAPLVASYLAAGGGRGSAVELFVDFAPLVADARANLERAAEGTLVDPFDLLGLEQGTWLYASADVFPGTRLECRAELHLPADTLVAELADTFQPLPPTLAGDLPTGIWGLWALSWDAHRFYERARAAWEEAGGAQELMMVDGALGLARGRSGVDPVQDVLQQLAGDLAVYLVEPAGPEEESWSALGIHAGLKDGASFRTAFQKLLDVGDLTEVFSVEEVAGVEAYVAQEDAGFDGGIAILQRAFTIALSRRVLEGSLRAQGGVDGASLLDGSRMQAALEGSAGACFLSCVEMTPLRAYLLPELEGDLRLPPLEEGQPARDPFDAQLLGTVRRTREGFDLRLETR